MRGPVSLPVAATATATATAVASLLLSAAPAVESFQPWPALAPARTGALHSTANPPKPPDHADESFMKGAFSVRNILLRGEKQQGRPRHGRDVVRRIDSIAEYKEKVVDEAESIMVVRFFSPFCRSCKASEAQFYRLAADYHEEGVKFAEVPLSKDNVVLHEALGVPSLPWTHIYHPEAGLVEERKVSKKHVEEVRKCLRCYVYGECDLEDEPGLEGYSA